MTIRQYKPTSSGRRAGSVSRFEELTSTKSDPEKSLVVRHKKKGGRNHQGKITARHRGGGQRQMHRLVDFSTSVVDTVGVIKSVEYDPCRTARVALVYYANGQKRYLLAYDGARPGIKVQSANYSIEPVVGNRMPLSKIPLGMTVHAIEMQPGGGAKLCRAAGTGATLSARDRNWAQITLPSGEVRRVPAECRATIGFIGNKEHQNVSIGKAGRNRWRGIRPYVRGVAMNPIAHPMGGGEGRTSGGRHPCSPTGKLAKGGRTRSRRKPSSSSIIKRRWSRRHGQLKT